MSLAGFKLLRWIVITAPLLLLSVSDFLSIEKSLAGLLRSIVFCLEISAYDGNTCSLLYGILIFAGIWLVIIGLFGF